MTHQVIKLEAHIDSHTNLGACYHNRSILPDAPASMCKPLYCLWSAKANAYIDMWDRPLTKTTRAPEECDKYDVPVDDRRCVIQMCDSLIKKIH